MANATTPAPVYAIADIVRRMNAAETSRPGRKPVQWTYRNVVQLLKTGGVRIIGEPGCKRYVTLTDLREAFPSFVDSLLFAETIAEAVQSA